MPLMSVNAWVSVQFTDTIVPSVVIIYIVPTHTASSLEDLLTLYFSHPAVEGVLLWGFWDGILWLDDSKLAEGPNVTVII